MARPSAATNRSRWAVGNRVPRSNKPKFGSSVKLTGSFKSAAITGGGTPADTPSAPQGAQIAESGAGRAAAGVGAGTIATGADAGVTGGVIPSAAAIACASFGLMSRYPHSMREISDGLLAQSLLVEATPETLNSMRTARGCKWRHRAFQPKQGWF